MFCDERKFLQVIIVKVVIYRKFIIQGVGVDKILLETKVYMTQTKKWYEQKADILGKFLDI